MRILALLSVLFILCSGRVAADVSFVVGNPPAPLQPDASGDKVFWLVGTWDCLGTDGVVSHLSVIQTGDSSVVMTHLPSGQVERYVFDSKQRLWLDADVAGAKAADTFTGTAQPWTGTTWLVAGHIGSGTAGWERKIFTFHDSISFDRQVTIHEDTGRETVHQSTCIVV
jgi:hypothetical protein